MAANNINASLTGSLNGLLTDGKKTIVVTKNYNGTEVSLPSGMLDYLSPNSKTGANDTLKVDSSKLSVISTTGVSGALTIYGSAKANQIYLGSGGGEVYGGEGNDKFYGSSKADTFHVAKGDVIGDKNNPGYEKKDTIVLDGASLSNLSFTDNLGQKSVVINNIKDKITVFKDSNTTQLNIKTNDATFTYGVDGTNSELSSDGKTLKVKKAFADTIGAATLAAGAKNIDATGLSASVYLVGNSQANNISIGSGGGTIYGGTGYDASKKTYKATNDNLYGNAKNAVTFLVDANGGNDNVFGYKSGDIIKIADGKTSTLDFSGKNFKDGGYNKDISITYNDKSKIAIKSNTETKIVFDVNGTLQAYGVDMPTGLELDEKRTSLLVTDKFTAGGTVSLDNWSNGLEGDNVVPDNDALKTFAPKINTIDATKSTGKNRYYLKAQDSDTTILKAGTGGASMEGGTAADQFYGGAGADMFIVNADTISGKDVINDYGANDIIVLTGLEWRPEEGKEAANSEKTPLHYADDVYIDTKGVVYFSDSTNKDDQKTNSISVKNFKNTTTAAPIVVADENGNVLAVNSNAGVPAPIGMTVDKTGITTTDKFTGAYASGTYAKGAKVDLTTGKVTQESSDDYGKIDAATYGGAVKAINASVVGSGLTSIEIKGNKNFKNTIYTPVKTTGSSDLIVNVHGGAQNDTFIGNTTATKSHVTYNIDFKDKVGKDVIENYNPETDVIYLQGVTLKANDKGYVADDRVTEKGSDVIFTFDKGNTLTIKNGAAKTIKFADDTTYPKNGESDSVTYKKFGYALKDGLVYDSKHTAITALPTYDGSVQIDLTSTSMGGSESGFYYAGIKTVSLAGAASLEGESTVYGNDVANELYAAPKGTALYGGPNASGNKVIADKLYGNISSDTFYYRMGEGADVIGNTKSGNEQTLFDKNDTLVLAGDKEDSVLSLDDLTFTDKKNVLTITIGQDKTKLTVNKTYADTPVNLRLTNKNFDGDWFGYGSEKGNPDGYEASESTFVYGIDTVKFQADATNIEKGTLNITGAGTGTGDITYKKDDGSDGNLALAVVDVRYVNSGLKNIGVNAGSNTAVSLLGGVSALNVTMGSAGGTVEGGKNGTKVFNDKFYANGSATLGTTFVLHNNIGGKDNIYDYDASRGDTLYFASGKPSVVKYSKKTLTIGYDAKHTFVLNFTDKSKTFEADTNIRIAYADPTDDNPDNINVDTYYGWNANDKTFADYTNRIRDEHWNLVDNTKYVYTGKNDSENIGLYGTTYTLQGDAVSGRDSNADYVPDEVSVDSSGVISFENIEETSTYLNPAVDGFHIQGQAVKDGSELAVLAGGSTFHANGVDYKLADVDGNTVNGYELSFNNWVKTDKNTFVYFSDGFENVAKGAASLGSAHSQFTLTGAISDISSVGEINNIFSKLEVTSKTENNVTTSELTIYSPVELAEGESLSMTDARIILQEGEKNTNSNYTAITKTTTKDKFQNANKYTVKVNDGSGATYKLYDADGQSDNGYELLRTDLADKANWTLLTAEDGLGSQQANNSGIWQYSDTTNYLAFQVSVGAGIQADRTTGLPIDIAVGSKDSEGKEIEANKTTIFINKTDFNTNQLILDEGTKVGSETGAVRISGLGVGTNVTIGTGVQSTQYILAELDGDTGNGFELVKANKDWTFKDNVWIYNNSETRKHSDVTLPAMDFTVSAALYADENGAPKGITVASDTGGKFYTLNFEELKNTDVIGEQEKQNLTGGGTTTSVITFGNIPTGDVQSTTRIIGFDSNTATFTINNGTFYLTNLDSDTSNYELLPIASNWIRANDTWNYYTDGVDDISRPAPQLSVKLDSDTTHLYATANGEPVGISVTKNDDGISQITINETLGASTVPAANGKFTKKNDNSEPTANVIITPAMLALDSTTVINSTGVHILANGTQSSLGFDSETTIKVNGGDFKLANLDRNKTNGYELLTTDTTNTWTFNNGDEDDKPLGSWTFSTTTKIGSADEVSTFTFTVGEAATLLPADADGKAASVKAGNPEGIYVSIVGTEANIIFDKDTDKKRTSAVFDFGESDTAKAWLLSDTGVHFFGLDEDDTIAVRTGKYTTTNNKTTTDTVIYRLKDLNGDASDGLELLRDAENWTLTTDSNKKTREWTYNGKKATVTASPLNSTDGLWAHTLGHPVNLDVTYNSTTGITTIYVDSDSTVSGAEKFDNNLARMAINVSAAKDVGSGGTVHMAGVTSEATVSVAIAGGESAAYRLANLDTNTKDLELIAYNENWRYYDSDVSAVASALNDNGTFTSGTWLYTATLDADKKFYVALDSDVVVTGTGESAVHGVATAKADGTPDGVTIESGKTYNDIVVTFDTKKLTNISDTTTKTLTNVTFSSDATVNASGIHIKGIDTGTTVAIGTDDYYLANLDGDTTNGSELVRANDNWKRTATGWTYVDNDGTNMSKLGFTLANTLSADENGAPIGITVKAGDGVSDTLIVDTASVKASEITFAAGVNTGVDGIHVSLEGTGWSDVPNTEFSFKATKEATNASTYHLRELSDKDTDNGYELLISNTDGWDVVGNSSTGRTWTYTNTKTKGKELIFSIDSDTGTFASGLQADSATGLPIGVSVDSATSTITFTTDSNITLGQLTFTSVPTGVNGIHVKGLKDSDTGTTGLAYTTDPTKMVTFNGAKYYFADLNETTEADHELIKYDVNWHRNQKGWTYTDTDIKFTFDSDTKPLNSDGTEDSEQKGLRLPTTNANGTPDGVSVTGSDGQHIININTSTKIADFIVFDKETVVNNKLHISLSGSQNADVKYFRKATETDGTNKLYYAVNTDGNANNGAEFYESDTTATDGFFKRTSDGWDFSSKAELPAFTFKLNVSTNDQGANASDAGRSVPENIDISLADTDSSVTLEDGSKFGISDITLTNVSLDVTAKKTDNTTTWTFASPHFKASNLTEGTEIKTSDGKTYHLYNIDSQDGLELTYNGWTNYSSGGTTFYAYVKDNKGFAIAQDNTAGIFNVGTVYASIAGTVNVNESSSIFSVTTASTVTNGFVAANLTSENFHVMDFNGQSNVAADKNVKIGNIAYTLKDLDSNTDTGFELAFKDETNFGEGYWTKKYAEASGSGDSPYYVFNNSTDAVFSIEGGTASTNALDTNYDFVPDKITKVSLDETTGKSITFDGSLSDANAYKFDFGSVDDIKYNVVLTKGETGKSYHLAKPDNATVYSIQEVTEPEEPQLAADSAEAWSGYDVEDLINYDGGVTTDSDLDSILEPTEIGVAETFGASDPADLLTGVATKDKSLNALTNAARHRARK